MLCENRLLQMIVTAVFQVVNYILLQGHFDLHENVIFFFYKSCAWLAVSNVCVDSIIVEFSYWVVILHRAVSVACWESAQGSVVCKQQPALSTLLHLMCWEGAQCLQKEQLLHPLPLCSPARRICNFFFFFTTLWISLLLHSFYCL